MYKQNTHKQIYMDIREMYFGKHHFTRITHTYIGGLKYIIEYKSDNNSFIVNFIVLMRQ